MMLPQMLPMPPSTTNTNTRIEVSNLNFAADTSRPFDGIPEMLTRLKGQGIALAILSNKPDAALQPLAQKYFSDLVGLAMGEREGVRRKPWPDMLEMAADALGVELRRCLYVGDTEIDIETAKNAGIDCACVSWGFRTRDELRRAGADVIVDTPIALAEFCEKGRLESL